MDALSSPYGDSRPARGLGPYAPATRVVALLLGGLAAALGAYEALAWASDNFPLSAAAWVVACAPVAAFFLAMGVAPARVDVALGRVSRATLADGGHVFALVTLAVTLFIVFGYGSVIAGANSFEKVVLKGEGPGALGDVDESGLLASLVVNLIVFVAPPLLWVTFVLDAPIARAWDALGLRGERAPMAISAGAAAAIASIVVIAAVSYAITRGGVDVPENDRALAIARSLSIPAAIAVAALSGFAEEVFFRGFLTPRVGLVAQAVLFSLAHSSYVNVLESVVTFALAIAFALLHRWTRNLWAPVAAHFTFNLVMLLAGRLAP